MHIADGLLNLSTCAATGTVSAGVLAYGVKKTKQELDEKQIPLLGVTAAFVFAAQMINFPVLPGTSGHLIGAVLIAVLLGPWTASIIMATVLAIQALFFGDGGIIALAANIFNMAIVSTFAGYYLYSVLSKFNKKLAIFTGAWAGVVLASLAAAVEIAFSGVLPLNKILLPLIGIHAVIGIGEGLITLVVITYLEKVKANLNIKEEDPYHV
ncbi:MAG: cobalt/nickel transport system permease protein [Clostridia bacterium]|jgi:cobalt/nickel transport system permease protein|nr:cobalt/nickel transport system permease protein [Clostridia bacterium]